MDKFNPKEARRLLTLSALKDTQQDWNYKWDECTGELQGKSYKVTYFRDNAVTRTIYFSMGTYLQEIKKGRNEWINNKLLNRSELAGRIWEDDISQNKLRRRLENKAFWQTFTEKEKEKIITEVANLYYEILGAFKKEDEIKVSGEKEVQT